MDFIRIIIISIVIFGKYEIGQCIRPMPNYPCHIYESISIEGGTQLSNKSILFEGIVYPPDLTFTYVVDSEAEWYKNNKNSFKEEHKRGCICKLKSCIRKCCPRNKYYVKKECVDTDIEFKHNVTDLDGNIVKNGFDELGIVYGNSCPRGLRWMVPLDDVYEFVLLPNGSVNLPYASDDIVTHYDFCLDNALIADFDDVFSDEDDYDEGLNKSSRVRPILLMCFGEPSAYEGLTLRFVLLSICMIFSILFLVATLLIHLILPELRTLHGKCIMCCIAGLIAGYTALGVLQLTDLDVYDTTCYVLGFIVYYSFMFTFFWLNATSFDIWWSFSGYRFCSSRTIETEKIKFTFYSIYAWGGSLFIFAITLGMHHHPNLHVNDKPGIGLNHCWLQDATIFRYFYGPILFLIIMNVIFFIASSITICNINRSLTMEEHTRFYLILKMFLIMGVTWLFEILSWWLGGSKWLWIVTDLFNALQGMLIFIVYIYNPKVRQLLKRRFQLGFEESPPTRGVEFNRKDSDTLDGVVRTKELLENMSDY